MLVFVVHSVSPSVQVTDSRLSVFTAYSVYRHCTLDLSRLPPQARSQIGTDDYDVVNHDGALLPFYPYGPMVMLTPAVAAPDLAGFDPAGLRLIGPNETWKIEVPSASLLVALSTVAMALIGYALTSGHERLRVRVGLTTALFFGFGTAAWSTASRSFGQHTPAMFFIALALMVLIAGARTSRWSLVPVGACLAAAYVMRPTSAITVAVLGVWILLTQRDRLVGLVGGAAAVLVPFVAVNLWVYGKALAPYYDTGRPKSGTRLPFLESLGVNAISPSRGLLVYTPLLVLIPLSVVLAKRRGGPMGIYYSALVASVMHWVVISSYGYTAGSAYGARFFTEITPLFVVLLVPLFTALMGKTLSTAVRLATVALVVLSVLVNAGGATLRSGFCWSASPVFIDDDPGRLWDLSDPQLLRPLNDLADGRSLRDVVLGSCPGSGPRNSPTLAGRT